VTINSKGAVWFFVIKTITALAVLTSASGNSLASNIADSDSSKQYVVGDDHPVGAKSASRVQRLEENKHVPPLFYAGVKLFNNARYAEALDVLNRAAKDKPEIGDTHALLAACLSYTGRYQDAENEFVLAEKYGNRYREFDFDRGLCAAALHNYKQSADCFNEFIAGRPGNRMTVAKHAQAIVVNDFLGQPTGNYLSSATKRGIQRWNFGAHALRVYIDENTAPDKQTATVLKESFNQWSKSPSPITFVFVDSAKKAQIQCSWSDNPDALGVCDEITDGVVGITKRTTLPHNKQIICSAKIVFFNLQNGSFRSREQILAMSRSAALHEIGHALGLGHSDYSFDTMYPILAPCGTEFPLTNRDLNTIFALYTADKAKRPNTNSTSPRGVKAVRLGISPYKARLR
jgi:hypothetical protein